MSDLKKLIEITREKSFNPKYWDKVSDQDVLGVLIAQHFKWDGQAIFDTMQNAFNDANFHTFNETMRQAWDKQP
jgi:hypothetical protein